MCSDTLDSSPITIRYLPLVLLAFVAASCSTLPPAPADWTAWQTRRNESIGGTNGWTTLIGLHWLKEGDNSAGSAPTNQVVLRSDRVPNNIGVFTRTGKSVTFTAAENVDVRVRGEKVGRMELKTDASSGPTRLQVGAVSMVAIERGDRLGLRVRDPDSATRRAFKGLRWFPYNPAWRLEGKFVAFPVAEKLRVPDVTGAIQEFTGPGAIEFTVHGSVYRLTVVQEPGDPDFFLMFHDETSGVSTYGAGRFLSVSKPDADQRVVIDFNRAYTPPCGFTAFATCPIPPRQNWLKLAVKAGELNPAGH